MNRTIAVAVFAILAAAALVFVLRGDDAPQPPAGEPRAANREPAPPQPTTEAPRTPLPVAFLVDDDVEGELRLEGQVIDETDDPVAGAEVTIDSNPPRSVATEADGSFVFDKLVGRRYTVVATSSQGVGGPVTARLNETSDPVILRLGSGAAVEVEVVDAATRRAIAGATVEARGAVVRAVATDGRGVARIAGLPGGRWRVTAAADGYAPATEFLRLAGDDEQRQAIELRRGAALAGRVVAPDGTTPVAGALVTYEGVSDWRVRADPRLDAAVTGADGAFSVGALAAGTVRLTARHDDHAPATTAPITLDGRSARTDVVIRLEPSATVAGIVVTADEQPVPYATVRVAEDRGGRRGSRPRQTSADAGGRFEVAGLPRRAVRVVAVHDRASSETATLELEGQAEQRGVKLVLSVTGVISGVVVNGAGEPVEGAQVMVRPDFRRGAGDRLEIRLRGLPRERTDAGGRFEFTGLQDIDYVVIAAPSSMGLIRRGWRPDETDSATRARVGDAELRLVLPAEGGLEGKVAFDDGSVPETFVVATGRFARGRPFSTRDGAFEVSALAPGTYRVAVRGPGFEERAIPDVIVEAGQVTDVGTINVRRGSVLSGRVVDASGQPVEAATVQAGAAIFGSGSGASAGRRFSRGKSATTDASGEFAIRGLPVGRNTVVAEHETAGRSVPVAAGESGRLELVLQPFSAIEGTVTRGGAPAGDAFVRAQSKTVVSANFLVQTGPDGRFRFDRLAPDRYLLSASTTRLARPGRGMGADARSASVGPGETVAVDIELVDGEFTLLVRPVAEAASELLASVTVVAGVEITARTSAELDEQVARRESGFAGFAFASAEGPAKLTNLAPATYTVCAVPYPAELERGEIMDYRRRRGGELPIFCAKKKVGGDTLEIAMDLPVELPAYGPAGEDAEQK